MLSASNSEFSNDTPPLNIVAKPATLDRWRGRYIAGTSNSETRDDSKRAAVAKLACSLGSGAGISSLNFIMSDDTTDLKFNPTLLYEFFGELRVCTKFLRFTHAYLRASFQDPG